MREMKDSGIRWMGDIPSDWNVERVKHGFVRKKEEAHQENPIVLSLARAGVKARDISNNEGQIAESYYNYNPVDVDDLLINPMDLYSGANCSISKIKGVISPAYINLRYCEGHNPNYYDYYFKVQYWMMAFFAHGKGVSYENRWTLNAETLMNYPIIVPPFNEQCRIVKYLDLKCSQIDAIIEKQQTIIEKLKEYKLSIISEIVTNGLKFDVEKKKSSIPYIGSIPKHWLQTNFGNALELIQTGPFGSQLHADDYIDNGTIFLVNPANIQNGKIVGDVQCTLSEEKAFSLKQHMMQVGDIVFARRGEMGRCACVEDDGNRYFCGTGSIRLKCNSILDSMYATFYLQTSYVKQYLELNAVGTTMANLNSKIISDIPILLPPIEEQRLIINYLNKEILNIDDLLDKQLSLVKKLQEYKKSLIYEVVTGKKEV